MGGDDHATSGASFAASSLRQSATLFRKIATRPHVISGYISMVNSAEFAGPINA